MPENPQEPDLNLLIVTNKKLPAIDLIRKKAGCSIPEALDMLAQRYRFLRSKTPDEFTCTDENYWGGFRS